MSASPSASYISEGSSTRATPNTSAPTGKRNISRYSIQKHTKSRSGCKTCKKRKVKCDEKRPSCGNCVKHAVHCDFALLVGRPNNIVPAETVPSLNLLDLELLNNFTSSTYNTLSNDANLRSIWKNAVVRKALGSEFVMRALLAVSAVHIAQHRPNQQHHYLSHAVAYHEIASRKAITLMTELLPENLEDLWIFAVFTMFFAMGSPRNSNSAQVATDGNILPEWMFLFNGVYQIFFALQSSSYTGILSPIVEHGKRRWIAAHTPEHENANILHDLLANIKNTVADEEEIAIYSYAIQELRCQLSFVLSSSSHDIDLADVFVWHFAMAESFMPLLQQGRQEAAAIFAHSLIVFSGVNSSRWLNGWDTFLLSRVWDVLDPEHRLWIQWPIEEIGWTPPV